MTHDQSLDAMAFDIESMPINAIALSDQDRAQAAQWAKVGFGEAQQWNIYRNSLAVLGLKEWLQWRGVQPGLDYSQSSLLDPVAANLLNATARLKIGDYLVALCIQDSDLSDGLAFPELLRFHSPFSAHLYLWAQLSEEGGWVSVVAGMWCNPLAQILENKTLFPAWETIISESDQTLDEDGVLLALRCSPSHWQALNQPTAVINPVVALTSHQLDRKLQGWSELSIGAEIFELPEGLDILRSPQLSSQFTQTLQAKFHFSLWSNVAQQGTNVWHWLSDALDAAIQDLTWVRVPLLATAMRSQDPFTTDILNQLRQQGVNIPAEAAIRYHDLSLGQQDLRLFAMVWVLENSTDDCAWTLLLVLCPQSNQTLTESVQMDVRDTQRTLAAETLSPRTQDGCGFIQVSGEIGEEFWVTLSLPAQPQMTMTLPPFSFYPQTPDSTASESNVVR